MSDGNEQCRECGEDLPDFGPILSDGYVHMCLCGERYMLSCCTETEPYWRWMEDDEP